ncbi:DUF4129 domain-containing protein [Chryseobacterium shandongense]|uniref:DUF4129 domain-containing protein n=1 Tax=Chryseobacterium shandongense TaxID=1493872 RepID=A0AAD0YDN0_9FLAO|nr:DUF4129 domain-containing protein [Chryseobacterium shandongense]AZA87040.1 DUF4129 domain-containing protein [Chryseobacterium shandongense]AZA95469.1 DUF4129 domain-containing protein [Chryseobacterium shandongense]
MNKLFVFLLISFAADLHAQDDPPPTAEVYIDSISTNHYKNMYRADSVLLKKPVTENTVYPKKFKENVPSRYKGEDFDYTTTKPRMSVWEKLMKKIVEILNSIFGETVFTNSSNIAGMLVRLFAIILAGFLLYFIIKYLIGKDGNFLFGKKNKKVDLKDEELHENIHEINFPESILKFEKSGDFRSAVRYQFLFVLKKLSDKKLIAWNPEKTNKDYVAELKAPHLKEEFFQLSYIFEYVWYGEFSISEESYQQFKTQYQSFKP